MSISSLLATDGYVTFQPHELADTRHLLHLCQQPAPLVKRRKSFLDSINVSPAIQAAAEGLNLEPLLSGYLPHPHLLPVEMYLSTPQRSPYKSGQLWHLDIDFVPQVKLFMVIHDTTADNGPFTFLSAPESAYIQQQTSYIPGKSLDDSQITSPPTSLTGPAGSSVLIDTSRCLHLGSRVISGSRTILVCQFVSSEAL